jgi:hypothetical protein
LAEEALYPVAIVIVIGIAVPTTVQVDEKTLQMLNEVKRETKAKSLDEVIKTLVAERKRISRSMFGSNCKLNSFSDQDEAEFHDV